ncbi:hypothetical protein [Sporichthya sp.]|uniref:hypothetical protein n=1 Tax=Sporichthya sp. TaxID=65475 RepID=UPI0017D14F87|nr:hypothetical protein [Sporichthya sp.]MBA3745216.1 hypothetical protein [Sporichthya sp.]
MPKMSIALLASAGLLLPAAVLATPVAAAPSATSATIKNCVKTKHGVTVRIKLRDNGRFTRVRVSHPDGKGNFYAPKVQRVEGARGFTGDAPPPNPDGSQIGGGASRDRLHAVKPSFRAPSATGGTVSVSATFHLRSGKSVTVGCGLR